MTYTELNTVSKSKEFSDLCLLAFIKAATQIRSEAPSTHAAKRQALAESVLGGVGGGTFSHWRLAVITNFGNEALLTPFLSSPVGVIDPAFDAALSNSVASVWNGLAGIYLI